MDVVGCSKLARESIKLVGEWVLQSIVYIVSLGKLICNSNSTLQTPNKISFIDCL